MAAIARTRGRARIKGDTWRRMRKSWPWYLFILPNVLGFLAFGLFPLIAVLVLSFYHWYLFTSPNFLGLRNFVNLAGDDEFLTTLRNTAAYAVMAVVPGSAVALGLALAVNQALRGMALFRILFFIPVVTSITVISFLWNWIYTPDSTGPLNYLLHYAGIGPQQWLQSSTLALPSLAAFGIWSSAGYTMILWLAGLQTVPVELYDAASVDGANRWQRFRHVTLPMLKPTTIFIVMVGTIGALQMFGPVYLMTCGGPAQATESVVYWIYKVGFLLFQMGRAAAGTTVLFVIILVIALLQRRFLGWTEELY